MTSAGDAAVTRGQVSEAVDPLGWRLILGVVTTHVLVPSLDDAARAVAIAVCAAGTDGTGHLTAEVTSGRAVLRLHTAASGAITGLDLALARRITEALAAESLTTVAGDAVPPQTIEIAIDALDIARVRPFWQAVTGYVDEPHPSDLPPGALQDPLRRGPTIWFQQMDEPRTQRNRIHLDVDVPPEHAQARIDAALAAGGTLLDADAAPSFWVLGDPEGNEACICTWQGRD
ncbi:VOC family protein [Mycolicibacterium lacusdiani]|uniref:VOC family protein n=1 Tax=Mycolicibacterium lacusdiani TaxID=2895283 RepID=UPI001F1A227B|nr:VOC family protein [Mycolicibacterium lacusdiani]